MDREEIESLKNIYIKFNKNIDMIAKEFIEELKIGCITYENVKKKLDKFEKDIMYSNNYLLDKVMFAYVRVLIDKEMNDLHITNRSKK